MKRSKSLQADVFSLGVILFELFLRKTLAAEIMEMDNNPGQIEMFAYKVSQYPFISNYQASIAPFKCLRAAVMCFKKLRWKAQGTRGSTVLISLA